MHSRWISCIQNVYARADHAPAESARGGAHNQEISPDPFSRSGWGLGMRPGAYEPPEGRKERPTLHYSVERHLILNAINTSLIWTYPQVVMSGVESVVFIANAHRVYV